MNGRNFVVAVLVFLVAGAYEAQAAPRGDELKEGVAELFELGSVQPGPVTKPNRSISSCERWPPTMPVSLTLTP